MRINKGFFLLEFPFTYTCGLPFPARYFGPCRKQKWRNVNPIPAWRHTPGYAPGITLLSCRFLGVSPSSGGERGLKTHFSVGEGKTHPGSSPSCSEWRKEPKPWKKPFFQSPDPMICGDHRGWVTLKLLR